MLGIANALNMFSQQRKISIVEKSCIFFIVPLILFLLFFHIEIIDPRNVGWLLKGDWGQHFLGWEAFRHDVWRWPLGASRLLDWPTGETLVYTDSNPLLALFLKPFSAILPDPFQYIGPWFLYCLYIQYFLSYKIISKIVNNFYISCLSATIMMLLPTLYWRMIHDTLFAQWLIIWFIWIFIIQDPKKRDIWFSFGLAVTSLIHFYLLVMVSAIWASDCFRRAIALAFRRDLKGGLILIARQLAVVIPTLIAMVCAGYFTERAPAAGGFGLFGMDLGSLINPTFAHVSLFMGAHPLNNFLAAEGFQYLGAGILFLISSSFIVLINNKECRSVIGELNWIVWLFPAFIILAILSLSDNITIFGRTVISLHYGHLSPIFGVIRASGRLFWPMSYAIVILAILIVCKCAPKARSAILIAALIIQVVDLSSFMRTERINTESASQSPYATLKDPRWDELIRQSEVVDYQPADLPAAPLTFYQLALKAVTLDRPITAMYSARVSNKQKAIQTADRSAFLSGDLHANWLYVLQDACIPPGSPPAHSLDDTRIVTPSQPAANSLPNVGGKTAISIHLGQEISFDQPHMAQNCTLAGGWSSPEDWGVWSMGKTALLQLTLLKGPGKNIVASLKAKPFPSTGQTVVIKANGLKVANIALDAGSDTPLKFKIPGSAIPPSGALSLAFIIGKPTSPMALGLSSDDRSLGVGLVSIRFDQEESGSGS